MTNEHHMRPEPVDADYSASPVVRLCNLILKEGLLSHAAQIRLHPTGDPERAAVEYFIDDEWRIVMANSLQAHRSIVARLRAMAACEPARQVEQAGVIQVDVRGARRSLSVRFTPLAAGLDEVTLDCTAPTHGAT